MTDDIETIRKAINVLLTTVNEEDLGPAGQTALSALDRLDAELARLHSKNEHAYADLQTAIRAMHKAEAEVGQLRCTALAALRELNA
jgi:hypothetical protein